SYYAHRLLHSFPTRRSSDLCCRRQFQAVGSARVYPCSDADALCVRRGGGRLRASGCNGTLAPGADRARPSLAADVDVVIRIEARSEEHTSELQSRENLVCRL